MLVLECTGKRKQMALALTVCFDPLTFSVLGYVTKRLETLEQHTKESMRVSIWRVLHHSRGQEARAQEELQSCQNISLPINQMSHPLCKNKNIFR